LTNSYTRIHSNKMYISSTYEYSFFVEMFLTRRIYKVFFTSDDSGYHSMSLLCKSFDFSITLAHVLPLQISLFRLESTNCSSSCPFFLFFCLLPSLMLQDAAQYWCLCCVLNASIFYKWCSKSLLCYKKYCI
jgi:hypothetical protein